ncbi:MAG: leucine--tRNA ligase [Candidatus Nanoarchaeia archaeon]
MAQKTEFNHKQVTVKWQKEWDERDVFKTHDYSKKKKFYLLEMFPYPSASGLHIGHAMNYTIGDIFARFKIMQGFNVLHPMGFDSFGLPAENAAIKAKAHPRTFTEDAIKNYVLQMKGLGLSYDWERMVETHKPEYYSWDQWIFLKMYEKGLAYKKRSPVNWCSKCNTVLANEQVHSGKCWRHEDTEVEIKNLEQWFFKTTAYADELYDGLDNLKEWPELIKKLQRNWIGKSQGTEIEFKINNEPWTIFTTRADTLMGVTFLVISAQHPRLHEIVTKEQKKEVEEFLSSQHSVKQEDIDQMEKEGVFTGSYALHPLNGEKIPVYAGNFVLADYGSGMVMAVPAHDQRDYEFAKKYGIEIKWVIQPKEKELDEKEKDSSAFTEYGVLINSGEFNGLTSEDAKEKITKELSKIGAGKKITNFRLRDWLISRQRFWGTPIPIVYCDKCGTVPVKEEDLPVRLPDDVVFSDVKNPLMNHKPFLETACPTCGGPAKRETDTMDTFVNSSWYYLRYTDPKNGKKIFDKKLVEHWAPVDFYIGGKEHACMHLIYIRFYTKFFRDLGLLNFDEPAIRLFNQGMLQGPDGEKMSKSKGNVILPEVVAEKYGLDAARLFLVSVASPDKDINWSDKGVEGSVRFLNKIINYTNNVKFAKTSKKVESKIHQAIKEVTECLEKLQYNIAVIKIRELFDLLEEEIAKEDFEACLKLLTPFCPHTCEELWESIGNKPFISKEDWPNSEESLIDYKVDYLDKLYEQLRADVSDVLKLINIQNPQEIKIIVSQNWKYSFVEEFRGVFAENKDFKTISQKLLAGDMKKYGQEMMKLLPGLIKDPSKIPAVPLTLSEEKGNLIASKQKLEEEFNCVVLIEEAETSQEQKARNAWPGKPALVVK